MLLVNARSNETLASEVELALTRNERRRGLLGRAGLDATAALVISPCWSIHTAFMKFAIDVLFVDRNGRTIQVVRDLPPWRITAAIQAHAVIEMPAGRLAACDIRIGDEIRLVPPPALHLNVLRRPAFGQWDRANARISADTP